jgi:hypothetical protein
MSVGQDVSIVHPLGRVDPNLYNVKYPHFLAAAWICETFNYRVLVELDGIEPTT